MTAQEAFDKVIDLDPVEDNIWEPKLNITKPTQHTFIILQY